MSEREPFSAPAMGSDPPLARLPPEVLRDIFLLCARMDIRLGCKLSCVSRSMDQLLAPMRRRTQIITTPRALRAFWQQIELEQLTKLMEEWRLPPAFSAVLSTRMEEVVSALNSAGILCGTASMYSSASRAALGHDVATERLATVILQHTFGCVVPRGHRDYWSSESLYAKETLHPRPDKKCLYAPTPAVRQERQPTQKRASPKGDTLLGLSVENLFIDISQEPMTSSATSPTRSPPPPGALTQGYDADDAEEALFGTAPTPQKSEPDLFTLRDQVDDTRQQIAGVLSKILSDAMAEQKLVQMMRELPARRGRSFAHLLENLPSLEKISLGAAEMQLYSSSFSHESLTPSEVTAVYDGTIEPLNDLVQSPGLPRQAYCKPTDKQRKRMEEILAHLHSRDTASLKDTDDLLTSHGHHSGSWPVRTRKEDVANAALQAIPHFRLHGIRQRLRKVHLIGIDPHSPMSGVPIPIASLDALRAGSVSPHSYLANCLSSLEDGHYLSSPKVDEPLWTDDDVSTGVTHIRYTTRRFGLRPVETTASQLRVFVQELAADRALSISDKERDSLAECLMAEWGVGRFQCLQISWASKEEWERQAQARASLRKRLQDSPPNGSRTDQVGEVEGNKGSVSPPSLSFSSNRHSTSPQAHAGLSASPSSPRGGEKVVGPLPRGSRTTEAQRRRAMAAVVRDPRPPRSPDAGVAGRNAAMAAADANGGWPEEHKDVWTDEFSSGVVAPPLGASPHARNGQSGLFLDTGKSGAERRAATAAVAFGVELTEGVRQTFGWHKESQLRWDTESSFLQRLRSGALNTSASRKVWTDLEGFLPSMRQASCRAALLARKGLSQQDLQQESSGLIASPTTESPNGPPVYGHADLTPVHRVPHLAPARLDRHGVESEPGMTRLHFDIHAPAEFMKFGGEAAFNKLARVDLFLDTITRGDAAWS